MRGLVALFLAALVACEEEPPPRTAEGEDCSERRCEDGLACVTENADGDQTCKAPPGDCELSDDVEFCDCEGTDTLCADDSIGTVCVSFIGSRVEIDCLFNEPSGEGEGEGEG